MKVSDPTILKLDSTAQVEKAPEVSAPAAPTSWKELRAPTVAQKTEVNFAGSIDALERRAPTDLTFSEAVKTDAQTDGWFQGAGGRLYDPATRLSDVAPVTPNNGKPVTGTKVVILGIMTTSAMQAEVMQNIANKEGVAVIGIRNATAGFIADSAQTLFVDKLGLGTNPATETLTRVMKQSLKAVQDGTAVTIPEIGLAHENYVAHSQGAVILSRSLEEVKNWLMAERGFTKARAEQAMSPFKIETYGGAAMNYPDGPGSITHNVNLGDAVPLTLGVALPFSHEGRGATVNYFFDVNAPSFSTQTITDGRGLANVIDSTIHGIAPEETYAKRLPEKKIIFQRPVLP